MNATEEVTEQLAQVCYAAQRELILSRGNISPVNIDEAPPPWVIATPEERKLARARVHMFWVGHEPRSDAPIEDKICAAIVGVVRTHVAGGKVGRWESGKGGA